MNANILIVDDSALMRRVICDIISSDSNLTVADVAIDGLDAYNKISKGSYDCVVLDMVLPKLMGVELLEKLYKEGCRTKVIIMSSSLKEDAADTFKAMEFGAVDFICKPLRTTPESRNEFAERILDSVRAVCRIPASAVKPIHQVTPVSSSFVQQTSENVRRTQENLAKLNELSQRRAAMQNPAATRPATATPEVITPIKREPIIGADGQEVKVLGPITGTANPPAVIKGKKIIALACSTGGPQALHKFVPMLPADLRYPLILVQHMPAGFTSSLAERLDSVSAIHVKEIEDGEFFEPGCVYITPGGKHLEVHENRNHEAFAKLTDDPPIGRLRPCADVMYKSLAETSYEEIICVVLTGMGSDGTEGITFLKRYRDVYCITQSAETCVVYGMPKSAVQKGISNEVQPLESIAGAIIKKLGV